MITAAASSSLAARGGKHLAGQAQGVGAGGQDRQAGHDQGGGLLHSVSTTAVRASSTGSPAGRNGVAASAMTAPASAARLVLASRRSLTISARITAGNIASRPNALVSCTTDPISAPSTAPPGQQASTPRPHAQ